MKNKIMQRTVICMYDGFGFDYFEESNIPTMKKMAKEGFFKKGRAVFPTLTNANNLSIICASWPEKHGVTTNCYFDEKTNSLKYFEDPDFIMAPTIFKLFKDKGIKSCLLTCKEKTLKLVGRDTYLSIAAETPSNDLIKRYGYPPQMYSADVNYWLWRVAIDVLKNYPDIMLIYIHTTDYPMHKWAPSDPRSQKHMTTLDELLNEAHHVAKDAQFLITADHGMNFKKICIDLNKSCREMGLELKFCVSPVADRLLEHHRGFGGVSYLYLKDEKDANQAKELILSLPGVEEVLTREESARRFHLMADRIGDLVVLGDRDTVFGDLPTKSEILDNNYRNHGSVYEQDVPIIAYGFDGISPEQEEINYNFDITSWLCKNKL